MSSKVIGYKKDNNFETLVTESPARCRSTPRWVF